MLDHKLFPHHFQAVENTAEHCSSITERVQQLDQVGHRFSICNLEDLAVVPHCFIEPREPLLEVKRETLKLCATANHFVILVSEFAIKEIATGIKYLPLQCATNRFANSSHSRENQGSSPWRGVCKLLNFFEIDVNHVVIQVTQLHLGGEQHPFNPQAVRPQGEANQLAMPPIGLFISPLHRHHGPGGGAYCQQTCNQGLKIKDDVAPEVSARLAFDLPRRTEKHGRNNRDYQHESHQNHNSLFIARPHHIPRQRHFVEVSHFSRESGSRMQPNQTVTNAVRDVGLFWKGCAA